MRLIFLCSTGKHNKQIQACSKQCLDNYFTYMDRFGCFQVILENTVALLCKHGCYIKFMYYRCLVHIQIPHKSVKQLWDQILYWQKSKETRNNQAVMTELISTRVLADINNIPWLTGIKSLSCANKCLPCSLLLVVVINLHPLPPPNLGFLVIQVTFTYYNTSCI